jgi:hypothetical protein
MMLRTSVKFAAALAISMTLGAIASAGPFFGDWCPPKDCPPGDYCSLHFMMPGIYRLRACVCPSNVDQYPDGACITGSPSMLKQPCRTQPAMPSTPYADPAAYYGRPMTPYVSFGAVSDR